MEKTIKLYLKKIINDNFDYDNEDESNKLMPLIEEEKVIGEKRENDNEHLINNKINILDDNQINNKNNFDLLIEDEFRNEEQSLDEENINEDNIIIDEDVNNNNCDELIKLIDVININDDKNKIQQNIKA